MVKPKKTRTERKEARIARADADSDILLKLIEGEKRARIMSSASGFTAVPTLLRSFNRATCVGGAPLSNVMLVHGPSAGGKTAFVLALIRSFQAVGGVTALVDAEFSAETKKWFPRIVDPEKCIYYGRAPELDLPPWSYEEIVGSCDRLIDRFRAQKKEGSIRRETPLMIAVDSVSKMVPANLIKRMHDEGGKGLSSGVGRLQAMLNTAWLAELGPRVGDSEILFVIIAHELESQGGGLFTQDYKVRGGGALTYDSMMVTRVSYAGRVFDASGEAAAMTAKRHRIKITKNKHGPGWTEATFYVSTGAGICPVGLDRVRETVHEAITRGVMKGPDIKGARALTLGSRLEYDGHKFALRSLYEGTNVEMVDAIGRTLDEGLFEAPAAGTEQVA